MPKVSILGLGWLGLPLAEQLQQEGWQVVGTKRSAQDCPIECYPLDFNDIQLTHLDPVLQTDALIFAIPPNVCGEDRYFSAVLQLAERAAELGAKQLIFLSSSGVLPQENGNWHEECAVNEGQLLVKVEQALCRLPLDCDVLRLAGLVGATRHPVYFLSGKSELKNAGQPVNLVHLADCLAAISLLLQTPNGKRLFHLCAPNHPAREDYYRTIAQRLNLPEPHFLPDNIPLTRVIEGQKIVRELGFRYQYPDPYQFPFQGGSLL